MKENDGFCFENEEEKHGNEKVIDEEWYIDDI